MNKFGLVFIILLMLTLSACNISKDAYKKSNLQQSSLNQINSEEIQLKIEKRIPEGTEEGLVNQNNIINYPLNEISVIFNKEINQTTLTVDNFYALWGIEEKIPASIVYNQEEKRATLKFNQPIISQKNITRITVVLKNIKSGDVFIDEYIYNIDIKN
ncbi:MAG: hypothetical protein ABIG10_00170 [bacterium]